MVPEEAQAYASMLQEKGIPAEIQNEAGPLPDYILGGMAAPRYLLLVSGEHLQEAEHRISEWMLEQLKTEPPADHPFKNYTKAELLQVISANKEWSDYDIAYAKYLLGTANGQDK